MLTENQILLRPVLPSNPRVVSGEASYIDELNLGPSGARRSSLWERHWPRLTSLHHQQTFVVVGTHQR